MSKHIKMISSPGVFGCNLVIGVLLASAAQPEDVSVAEAPYYRFATIVKDATVLADGTKGDVIVQYFATPQGSVGSVDFVAIKKGEESCGIFIDENGHVCWCDSKQPNGVSCFQQGGTGPSGDLREVDLLVNVVPEARAGGEINFKIDIQQILETPMTAKTMSGFIIDNNGSFKINTGIEQ